MAFKYDEHNKYHRLGRMALMISASLVVFIWLWWMISLLYNDPAIPDPGKTFSALRDLIANGDRFTGLTLSAYIKASLTKFAKGFLLACAAAIPAGLVLGYFKPLREFTEPWVEILRPIAPIAWAPIFIILFGYTNGAMMVVFIGIFFPLLTNVTFGVTKIDSVLLDAARTLGASPLQVFIKVLVPSTVPYVLNGIKVGLGVGWMCIVAAELYATPLGGIGFYVANMITFGAYDYAFAGIVVIAVLGLLTTGVAEMLSRIINKRMGIDA